MHLLESQLDAPFVSTQKDLNWKTFLPFQSQLPLPFIRIQNSIQNEIITTNLSIIIPSYTHEYPEQNSLYKFSSFEASNLSIVKSAQYILFPVQMQTAIKVINC